ncbi:hypothetical protein IT411_00605, partial [Candidatus Peregrinibacteria bacterium]|nr:hypothetical protein [Candidatus Peregrinibacteria bacterium]
GHSRNQAQFEENIFLTFSVEDENKTSSTYENLQASDQITESIQGWFKDPALSSTLEKTTGQHKNINAKKQEKNNLIISFDSLTPEESQSYHQALLAHLQQRLNSYNQRSDLKVNVATEYSVVNNKPSLVFLFGIMGLLIGSILGMVWCYCLEKFTQKVQEIGQLEPYGKSFQFISPEKMKKKFQFLSAYLNNKYSGDRIQLFDLTTKSKIALDTIAKNTQIKEIKSYNYPEKIAEANYQLKTILLVQLGYSKIQWLEEIHQLGIKESEIIVFNQV